MPEARQQAAAQDGQKGTDKGGYRRRQKGSRQPIRPALAASTRWQSRPLITPAQESDEMHSPAYAHYLLYLRVNFGPRPSEPPPREAPKQADPADKPTDETQKPRR